MKKKQLMIGVLIIVLIIVVLLILPKKMASSDSVISEIRVMQANGNELLELSEEQKANLTKLIVETKKKLVLKPCADVSTDAIDYEIHLHIDGKLWVIITGKECYAYQSANRIYRYDIINGADFNDAVLNLLE